MIEYFKKLNEEQACGDSERMGGHNSDISGDKHLVRDALTETWFTLPTEPVHGQLQGGLHASAGKVLLFILFHATFSQANQ